MKIEECDDLPLWSAPFGLKLLDTVRYISGINILDIGSGSGFPMLELAERFGGSSRVYGIDPSDEAYAIIQKKIVSRNITNAEIRQGYAESLPFVSGFFGLIVSNNGLNNVRDDRKTVEECFRVAARGCQMVLTMNLPGSLSRFYDVFREVLLNAGMKDELQKMLVHIDEKRKPVEHWKQLFRAAGFTLKEVHRSSFSMRFADGSAFLNHSLIANAFRPPWEALLPPERTGEIFAAIEQQLDILAPGHSGLTMEVPFVCFDCTK
jgi:arsenite methyltransferase